VSRAWATMKIHGLRIYPQSVDVGRSSGASIVIHGRVSEGCSDFFYSFRPLTSVWRNHVFAKDFCVTYDQAFKIEDPMPALHKQFGPSILSADVNSHLMLLKGDDFRNWGASISFREGAFMPIFREPPPFDLLKRLYWGRDFRWRLTHGLPR